MGKKYKNPPVIEAVCEFQFGPSSPWDLAIPGLVYEGLQKNFPKRRQTKRYETGLRTTPEGVLQEIRTTEIIQFLREDGRVLVQVGENLLSVNHLKPYPTWKDFLPMVRDSFDIYAKVAKPTGIKRMGLRYINRIEFPDAKVELGDYFSFYPFLGPSLPQDHGAFIAGVEFAYEDGRDGLRLQMTNAKADQGEVIAIVLDLDYFLRQQGSVSVDATFDWIETAHNRLEAGFEGCINEKLRTYFDEEKV